MLRIALAHIKVPVRILRTLSLPSATERNAMPYIARADYAKQKEIVGNGEYVTLARHLTGACASLL
ncbi:hypothetical protein D3C81_2209670 [compost metagenome]